MRRKAPKVSDYMSRLPCELEHTDTVAVALRMMRESSVRHLPVLEGVRLAGIVSRHDVDGALAAHHPEGEKLGVTEICSRNLLTVDPRTPLSEVTEQMLERKVGSALVVDGDVLVGIFTSSDALRALHEAYSS